MTDILIAKAAVLAEVLFLGCTRRYGDEPSFHHLRRVAERVAAYPGASEEQVAAAYLHDWAEDLSNSVAGFEAILARISAEFGDDVAWLVRYLSHDPRDHALLRVDRKARYRRRIVAAGQSVVVIKLIDKIDNIKSLAAAAKAGVVPGKDLKFFRLYADEADLLLRDVAGAAPSLERELADALWEYRAAIRER